MEHTKEVQPCINRGKETVIYVCQKKSRAGLIRLVIQLWKLWNCKRKGQSVRSSDPDFAYIDSITCPGMATLKNGKDSEIMPKPDHTSKEKRQKR